MSIMTRRMSLGGSFRPIAGAAVILDLAIVLAALVGMEGVAYLTHRYLMHGRWGWHCIVITTSRTNIGSSAMTFMPSSSP